MCIGPGERTMKDKRGVESGKRVAAPPMPERNDDDGEGEASYIRGRLRTRRSAGEC